MHPRILIGLLAGALAAVPATAQTVAATVSGVIDGTRVNPADCAQTFSIAVTVNCTRFGADDARFGGAARVDNRGRLRGLVAAGSAGAATQTTGSAGASWTDTVRFTPFDEAVTGLVFIRMDGTQNASSDGDGTALAALTLTFMRLGIYRDGSRLDPNAFDEVLLRRALFDYGTYQQHRLGSEVTVRGVPGGFTEVEVPETRRSFDLFLAFEIEPGVSSVDFFWQFATNATINAGFTGRASTSYFSTASITGFQFLDREGTDITARAGISFDSGQDYPLGRPQDFGAVPEPTAWALLIAGFGLTGAALRRRRLPALSERC